MDQKLRSDPKEEHPLHPGSKPLTNPPPLETARPAKAKPKPHLKDITNPDSPKQPPSPSPSHGEISKMT